MTRRTALSALAVPCLLWALALVGYDLAFWGLVFDDSFYYWAIGRNVAEGLGSTFDGYHETNGYHPLWLALCAALYALLPDGETTARLSVLLQVPMLWAGLVCVVLALEPALDRRPTRFEPALRATVLGFLVLAASSKDVVKLWVNGLESGLVLLFQAPILALAARNDMLAPEARRTRLLLSGLLTGAFLSRTDGALLLPAIALWALPRLARAPAPTARALVEALLLPSLVVLTFMALNQAWMGTPVQVSGQLKRAPLEAWRYGGAGVLLLVALGAARALPRLDGTRVGLVVGSTGFFGVFATMLVGYYGFLQRFPRLWYYGPVALWLLLVVAAALADLLEKGANEKPEVAPERAIRPLQLIGLVVGLLAVGRGAWSIVQGDSTAPLLANRDAALHVAATLPEDAVLASWDAGVVGFYAERPVVNLDGVVQSGDFLRALRSGTTADYLADVPIGWVVNHGYVNGGAKALQASAVTLLGPRADGLELVGTWPFFIFASLNGAAPTANEMQVHLLALPGVDVPDAARHGADRP